MCLAEELDLNDDRVLLYLSKYYLFFAVEQYYDIHEKKSKLNIPYQKKITHQSFSGNLRVVKPCVLKLDKSCVIMIANKCLINCADDMYELIDNLYVGSFIMHENSSLIVDNFRIGPHCIVKIFSNATLRLGNGFINYNCFISCRNLIEIGDNVFIGPNVEIRDNDSHEIDQSGHESTKSIKIGNDVWICRGQLF